MTYRKLYYVTVLLPPLLIGGFEYLRHGYLLAHLSMETGNWVITIMAFLLSYLFASWVFQMIKRMNQRLVEEQAMRAVYEERERLARELHDGIAQTLFFLNVKLRQGQMEEARAAVAQIDHQLRQAIFNLRSLPEEGRFDQRLEKWLEQWSALTGIDVEQQITLSPGIFTPAQEVQLFGIVQEAFANIRKHARATQAALHLHADKPGQWALQISDNGIGFQADEAEVSRYGISMMRERARLLGASFTLHVRPDGGTALVLQATERKDKR